MEIDNTKREDSSKKKLTKKLSNNDGLKAGLAGLEVAATGASFIPGASIIASPIAAGAGITRNWMNYNDGLLSLSTTIANTVAETGFGLLGMIPGGAVLKGLGLSSKVGKGVKAAKSAEEIAKLEEKVKTAKDAVNLSKLTLKNQGNFISRNLPWTYKKTKGTIKVNENALAGALAELDLAKGISSIPKTTKKGIAGRSLIGLGTTYTIPALTNSIALGIDTDLFDPSTVRGLVAPLDLGVSSLAVDLGNVFTGGDPLAYARLASALLLPNAPAVRFSGRRNNWTFTDSKGLKNNPPKVKNKKSGNLELTTLSTDNPDVLIVGFLPKYSTPRNPGTRKTNSNKSGDNIVIIPSSGQTFYNTGTVPRGLPLYPARSTRTNTVTVIPSSGLVYYNTNAVPPRGLLTFKPQYNTRLIFNEVIYPLLIRTPLRPIKGYGPNLSFIMYKRKGGKLNTLKNLRYENNT